ncbi:MAG: GGDEF domain-containing protein [bacterium]|nr:GGDEF domain-containing protein [bacterium]
MSSPDDTQELDDLDWPVGENEGPEAFRQEEAEPPAAGQGEFLLNLLSAKSRKGLGTLSALPRDEALRAFLSGGASLPRVAALHLSDSTLKRLSSLIGSPIHENLQELTWQIANRMSDDPPHVFLVTLEKNKIEENAILKEIAEGGGLQSPQIVALADTFDSPLLESPPAWVSAVISMENQDSAIHLILRNMIEHAQMKKDLEIIFLAHRVSREQLHKVTFTEPLTGLLNRAGFEDASARELARAARSGEMLGLLIIDIDKFKGINDTYGHPTGDSVLRELGRLLRQESRYIDHVVRFGGEEFGVVLPRIDLEGLQIAAERIRQRIEQTHFLGIPEAGMVTISIGALMIKPARRPALKDVYPVADELLYRAKQEGRNRVILDTYE